MKQKHSRPLQSASCVPVVQSVRWNKHSGRASACTRRQSQAREFTDFPFRIWGALRFSSPSFRSSSAYYCVNQACRLIGLGARRCSKPYYATSMHRTAHEVRCSRGFLTAPAILEVPVMQVRAKNRTNIRCQQTREVDCCELQTPSTCTSSITCPHLRIPRIISS